MAGRLEGDAETAHAPVTTEELTDELDAIKRKLLEATKGLDGSVAAEHVVQLLRARRWGMLAMLHTHLGERRPCAKCGHENYEFAIDKAAKAEGAGVKCGELAVKLSKSTLADRVLALEQALEGGELKGRGIADEAKRRKRAQE